MAFEDILRRMTRAACAGDGDEIVRCFTPDGVYHDVFYGSFTGPDIGRMITDFFHRDATAFRWDILECAEAGGFGMGRYLFSYESRLAGHEGRRAMFEGVALCRLRGGLIAHYSEIAEASTGLQMLGFDDARLARFAARQARLLAERPEAALHMHPADPGA